MGGRMGPFFVVRFLDMWRWEYPVQKIQSPTLCLGVYSGDSMFPTMRPPGSRLRIWKDGMGKCRRHLC